MTRALVVLILAAASAWSAAASYPRPERACGAILSGGQSVAIDIDEVGGRMKLSCTAARGVMGRYLAIARRHQWPPGGPESVRSFAYEGRRFVCYKSRPDGVGWDYHCTTSNYWATRFVDVAAGRRGHLCTSRSGRCPRG